MPQEFTVILAFFFWGSLLGSAYAWDLFFIESWWNNFWQAWLQSVPYLIPPVVNVVGVGVMIYCLSVFDAGFLLVMWGALLPALIVFGASPFLLGLLYGLLACSVFFAVHRSYTRRRA